MATSKLVSVLCSDQYFYEKGQMPLECDENLTVILKFSSYILSIDVINKRMLFSQLIMKLESTCEDCFNESLKHKELTKFVSKYSALSSDELAVSLMVTSKEVLSLMQQLVPCVGCRPRYVQNI